jgi:hypothetical protein
MNGCKVNYDGWPGEDERRTLPPLTTQEQFANFDLPQFGPPHRWIAAAITIPRCEYFLIRPLKHYP